MNYKNINGLEVCLPYLYEPWNRLYWMFSFEYLGGGVVYVADALQMKVEMIAVTY